MPGSTRQKEKISTETSPWRLWKPHRLYTVTRISRHRGRLHAEQSRYIWSRIASYNAIRKWEYIWGLAYMLVLKSWLFVRRRVKSLVCRVLAPGATRPMHGSRYSRSVCFDQTHATIEVAHGGEKHSDIPGSSEPNFL